MDGDVPPSPTRNSSTTTTIDDIIEKCIGESPAIAHILRAILVSLAWAFDAQQTFITIFTDADPPWHCNASTACASHSTRCALPNSAWAWDKPPNTAMVSEWSLHCASPAILGLPASAYFAGCMAGGLFLSTLADTVLGRKSLLFFSCLTMSVTGIITAISPNIWVYAALRFVCGVGRSTILTTSLVLANEMVGKKWRDFISIACYTFFMLGFLSLALVGSLSRQSSWKLMYIYISAPSLLYSISIYFLVHESPRWLLVRGRREEAILVLNKMASRDRTITLTDNIKNVEAGSSANVLSAIKTLCQKKWAARRLVAIMIAFFGIGVVYFGMPLNLENLGTNLYLSVAINALSELPSCLLAFVLIRTTSRKTTVLAFTTAGGVSSILCVFLKSKVVRTMMEVVSFFCACTAYDAMFIHAMELFPTSVRNSAVSMVRLAPLLGGAIAPVLVAAGRKKRFMSFGVFGLIIGCCGLSVAFLPETKGKGMSDTIEEEENKSQSLNGAEIARQP